MLFILETRKIEEPLKELLIRFIKLKQKIKCCVKFKPKWAYFYKHLTMSCKIVWCGIPCSLTYRWRIWKLGIIVFFIAMEILGGSMEWDDSIKIWEIIIRCNCWQIILDLDWRKIIDNIVSGINWSSHVPGLGTVMHSCHCRNQRCIRCLKMFDNVTFSMLSNNQGAYRPTSTFRIC